jgi:hypothetical protein
MSPRPHPIGDSVTVRKQYQMTAAVLFTLVFKRAAISFKLQFYDTDEFTHSTRTVTKKKLLFTPITYLRCFWNNTVNVLCI